jgi:ATP-dependent DNA helicase DinG
VVEEAPKELTLFESFPFSMMRTSQDWVLHEVKYALDQSKKFIILEAPVGFGKSAIAAALARHLRSAYLLTSTKQLQDQYSTDFRFPVVIGKSNFTCLVPVSTGKTVPCNKGRCEADWKLSNCPHYITFEAYDEHMKHLCSRDSKCENLKDEKLCAYYEQKWDAFRAPVMVTNYPFFMTELRFTPDIKQRKLLVCDEAHDLEKQMVGLASYTLRRSTIDGFVIPNDQGESLPYAIPDKGIESAVAWTGVLESAKQTLELFADTNMGDLTKQDHVASCLSATNSLTSFMEDLDAHPENWIVSSIKKTSTAETSLVDEVVFQPLEVGDYTSLLFESADLVLLMSATVFSKEVFCRTLGIPEEDAYFIRVKESAFPVENRRIFALNTAKLSKATIDVSLEAITEAVDEIMARHAGERGIIHTTSYHQTRYIMDHVSQLNKARLSSSEGVSSRSALIRAHGANDESVLISPSLYQGVDLKDELSRFQILVKVPYPDLSERRTRVKLDRDSGWYDWQTALRMVQTYGRSVRSETDHAVTYVLDSNFPFFIRKHRDLFPDYFLEALVASQ